MQVRRYYIIAAILVTLSFATPVFLIDSASATADIEITSVYYDEDQSIVSFTGTTVYELVNVRVYSSNYSSPVTACTVEGSVYSDCIYLGLIESGVYHIEVSYGSIVATEDFVTGSSEIIILDASYDIQSGMFHISGTTSSPLVDVRIFSESYNSHIDACLVDNGAFEDTIYLGTLDIGRYYVEVSDYSGKVLKYLYVEEEQGEDPYAKDSLYSEDGKTLIKYHGTASCYVLPTFIEYVADNAFNEANIDTFVLTKDVVWIINLEQNKFPFQTVSLKNIVIEDGVQEIPNYLFAHTEIEHLIIPSSVERVGVKSFYLCNNLKDVTFEQNSRITTIDQYAFSCNPLLNLVTFNSSREGYVCSFEKGCFFDCGSITVEVSSDFNLYSIGTVAFANDDVIMHIGGESGNIIHIPKTVGNLGNRAFSNAIKSLSADEPGVNTARTDSNNISLGRFGDNGLVGRSIILDDNPLLTSIGQLCFASRNPVDSIDLSGCSSLTDIGPGAFQYCLDTNCPNIYWPENVQTIGSAAFMCRGTISNEACVLCLPASIISVESDAFEGLCRQIIFDEGSELRYFDSSSTLNRYILIDLSNCSKLESLGRFCASNTMKLPVGLFSTEGNSIPRVVEGCVVATVNNGQLEIGDETSVIICNDVSSVKSISFSSSNPYFTFDSGKLSVNDGTTVRILLVSSVSTVNLGGGSGNLEISSSVIGKTVKNIHLWGTNLTITESLASDSCNIKNVYIHGKPTSWQIPVAFQSINSGVNFYVDDVTIDDLNYLKTIGTVYLGYSDGTKEIYVPTVYDGVQLIYSNVKMEDGVFKADLVISNGNLGATEVLVFGAKASITNNQIVVDDFDQTVSVAYLHFVEPLVYFDDKVYVTFIGDGGKDSSGNGTVILSLNSGNPLSACDIPSFSKPMFDFVCWKDDSGKVVDGSTPIFGDMVLHPEWVVRGPVLEIDQSAATILMGGQPVVSDTVGINGTVTFTAISKPGYEIFAWLLDGEYVEDASVPLNLKISKDSKLSVTYRYSSSSTGADSISNSGMPTTDDVDQIVKSYVLGGYIKQDGSIWIGMTSTPLVVDDYVYIRIANKIYKAESDTGYVVKSADSQSIETFYHYLGYGGGYIIDYNSSKVFDLNLNQLYVLDRTIESAYYYDGYFYVLGNTVYKFNPADGDSSTSDETKQLTYVGSINRPYGSYGTYAHEFVGDYVYCIYADGKDRGIAAMNLDSGTTSYCNLNSIHEMYLDDGWLSYYGGYLFVTAYSEGLFGAVATTCGDRLAYVPVDGLDFGTEKYYEFGGKSFTSKPAFYDNRLFVSISGSLYVFDLPSDLSNLSIEALNQRHVHFVSGHGNFVIDVSHANEPGSPVYAYGIPYDTHQGPTMWIAEDKGGVLTSVSVYTTEREWNSQTIRSDIDGRMLWYNDSGWLYSYTTSDKNVYYFFIEDGDSAVWYRAYGATAADALASLGNDVATLNAAKIIQTVNGHTADGLTLQMLKATYGTVDNNGQFDNLDQYSWVTITNLGDVSYSLNHYFRIICGNGESVTVGTEFSYVEDGERKTYTFADNIGDRSIIGKQLSRGTDVVFLRFYDEEGNELPNTASVVKNGSSAKIHFPEVNRVGYIPVWKDSSNNGNELSDIYGMEFTSNASFYLTWEPLPPGYLVTGVMETTSGTTVWSADVIVKSGVGSVGDLQVKVTAVTSDGRVLSDVKVTAADGKASGTFETADVALIYIRIVDEHVEGNLGYAMIEREAHP